MWNIWLLNVSTVAKTYTILYIGEIQCVKCAGDFQKKTPHKWWVISPSSWVVSFCWDMDHHCWVFTRKTSCSFNGSRHPRINMVNGLVVSNLLFHTILGWLADMNHDFWDGLPSGNLLHSYRKILKMAIDRWFTMIYLQKTSKNVELFHGYLSLQEASKKFRTHRVVHNTKVVLHSAPAAPRWRWVHGSCPKAGWPWTRTISPP